MTYNRAYKADMLLGRGGVIGIIRVPGRGLLSTKNPSLIMSTAIVFGANGISGIALLSHLSSQPKSQWKKIIALSRREPVLDHQDERIVFKSVDLLGPEEKLEQALKEAGAKDADHVFFYAYVAKQDEQELIDVNRLLFGNVSRGGGIEFGHGVLTVQALKAVAKTAPKLQSFQLQTGYKCEWRCGVDPGRVKGVEGASY